MGYGLPALLDEGSADDCAANWQVLDTSRFDLLESSGLNL